MSVSPAGRALLSRHLGNQTRLAAHGSGTATPEGSATQTITSSIPPPDGLVLRLRGADETTTTTETEDAQPSTRRRIQWAEDVIDNEGLGRKRSKVCCIYHKTRDIGESSSEDDSSSSSDSDGGSSPSDDDGSARPIGGRRGKGRGRRRERRHRHDHEHKDGDECGNGHEAKRKPSPNAYERMPKYDVKPLERQPGS